MRVKTSKLLVKGRPAGGGKVVGRARVNGPLKRGEIMVVKNTDPAMFVDIIQNAAGIVTDLGGESSHPAIVARELGIPCVVATKNATSVIKTGMTVVVDGTRGEVYEQD